MIGIGEIVVILGIIIAASFAFRMMRTIKRINAVPKPKPDFIDWGVLADPALQSCLPHQKLQAIQRYRELTNLGLKEAKETIEYIIEHPEALKKGKSESGKIVDTDGAGVKDLIAEGRINEAVEVYAAFMGVDEFTAQEAVEQLRREPQATERLGLDDLAEVRLLVAQNRKIEAIKRYRELTNTTLKEAKDVVDRMG